MQKRKISSISVRCMLVLILAIVMCAYMTITSVAMYLDTHTVYAANSYIAKSMTSATVNTDNSVTYTAYESTDRAMDGANQRSYFPTQYLELPDYGTYDLSKVLQKSVNRVDTTPCDSPMQYNDDPAHRIVGIERRGNMKLIDNSRFADAGYNPAGWGESIQGPGVFYRNEGGSKGMRSSVLYLTLAIPDTKTEYAHALKVGLDSTIYGQSNNRVDSAFAVFADPVGSVDAEVARWDGVIKDAQGIGFACGSKADWVVNGDTPHTAMINSAITYGAQRIGDGSLFSDIANGGDFRYQNHPLESETYDVPAGTKYIRIMIMSEVGEGVDFSITNFQVALEGYGPAPYTLESMGADTSGSVKYTRNNSRNGTVSYTASESVDGSLSYFPTSYLLPTLGTEVDMTGMLGAVVGNGANCYPGGKADRLIGVERRGSYTVHNAEDRTDGLGLTLWAPESAYSDPLGGNTFGAGLSVHGRTADAGSVAFYFTVAMPDHLVAGEGEYMLDWSFNTRSFGENVGGVSHRLSAGYAVYADTAPGTGVAAPIQNPTGRPSDASMGFDHSVPWSIQSNGEPGYNLREDRANGLVAVPSAHGTIYSERLENRYIDKAVHVSVPVPSGTRFLRCIVTFDEDEIASPTSVKQALTNMRLAISAGMPSVSVEATEGGTGVTETQQVMLRANTAGIGKPLGDIEKDIVIHAISPYTGEEWSSSYATLPDSSEGRSLVWKSGTYEDVTKTATTVAGDTLTKTYQGVGCNTRLNTRASRLWVTFGGASDERYRDVDIIGMDKGAPKVIDTRILAKDVHLTTITMMLDEQSDIASATISGEGMDSVPMTIDNVAKSVTCDVTRSGDYVIVVRDKYDYTMTSDVANVICHIGVLPELGEGVEIVDRGDGYIDAGEAVTYRFTSASYGYRLAKPISIVADADMVEQYNYGMIAEYTITYRDNVDSSMVRNIQPIDTHVTIDGGTPEVVPFGSARTYTANVREGQTFVGWCDADGILVSSNPTITIRPTRDVVLTTKTTPTSEVMIRFENMSGKTLDVQGFSLGGKTVEDIVVSINRSIADGTAHSEYNAIRLPVSPFETFVGWRILDDTDDANIIVRSVYETTKTFTITVDGTPHTVYANDRVSLEKYASEDTKGWTLDGVAVSNKPDYECYAMADMTFTSIVEAQSPRMVVTSAQANMPTYGDVTVLSGILNSSKAYSEVGFILIDGNIDDMYLRVDSAYTMRVVTHSVKDGQNMLILRDSAFKGTKYGNAKYRMYAIDATTGEAEYSSIYSL